MFWLGLRNAGACHVTVTNGLDFKYISPVCKGIKCLIQCLQQSKYLAGLSRGTPSSKSCSEMEIKERVSLISSAYERARQLAKIITNKARTRNVPKEYSAVQE